MAETGGLVANSREAPGSVRSMRGHRPRDSFAPILSAFSCRSSFGQSSFAEALEDGYASRQRPNPRRPPSAKPFAKVRNQARISSAWLSREVWPDSLSTTSFAHSECGQPRFGVQRS